MDAGLLNPQREKQAQAAYSGAAAIMRYHQRPD